MPIAVLKKEGESNEKLVSRFEKKVQQGRVVQFLKKNRFRKKKPNKLKEQAIGLKRSHYRAEREKMKYYL
jgi:ribosomal protein S21